MCEKAVEVMHGTHWNRHWQQMLLLAVLGRHSSDQTVSSVERHGNIMGTKTYDFLESLHACLILLGFPTPTTVQILDIRVKNFRFMLSISEADMGEQNINEPRQIK